MAEPVAAGVSSLPREVREQLAELELELSEGEERRAAPGSRPPCPARGAPARLPRPPVARAGEGSV